jgi:hypothetical protein
MGRMIQAISDRHTPHVLILVGVLLAAGIVTAGYLYYWNYEQHYRAEARPPQPPISARPSAVTSPSASGPKRPSAIGHTIGANGPKSIGLPGLNKTA